MAKKVQLWGYRCERCRQHLALDPDVHDAGALGEEPAERRQDERRRTARRGGDEQGGDQEGLAHA